MSYEIDYGDNYVNWVLSHFHPEDHQIILEMAAELRQDADVKELLAEALGADWKGV